MLSREEFLQFGSRFTAGLRPALARLAYAAREIGQSLRAGPPGSATSVLYETRLDMDPDAGADILHSVGHSFPLRIGGLRFVARAAGEAGRQRGFDLSLYITPDGWRESLWLWPRFMRKRAREQLRAISARIQLYAWTGEHADYAFAPEEYARGRWLSELYPSLRAESFRNRRQLLVNPFQNFGGPHAALAEQRRHPRRRRRRVLLLPMRARQQELAGLLPPPLQARWRVQPNTSGRPGSDADIRLYLRVFLDGGPLVSPDSAAPPDHMLADEMDPAAEPHDLSEWEPARAAGTERRLYFELLCPALLHADSLRTRGWAPVFARSIALDQPSLPLRLWNEFTASYRVRRDGFRFCLGNERRRLQAVVQGRPLRGLRRGDRPPRLARVPGHIFIQSPENLDVHVFRESSTVPANRIYVLDTHSPDSGARGFADWFTRRFGIPLTSESRGWFLSYADVESTPIARLPLTDCHYRPGVRTGPLPQ